MLWQGAGRSCGARRVTALVTLQCPVGAATPCAAAEGRDWPHRRSPYPTIKEGGRGMAVVPDADAITDIICVRSVSSMRVVHATWDLLGLDPDGQNSRVLNSMRLE